MSEQKTCPFKQSIMLEPVCTPDCALWVPLCADGSGGYCGKIVNVDAFLAYRKAARKVAEEASK